MTDPDTLALLVRSALQAVELPDRQPEIERPRQREHGDWSTNVALTLGKAVGRPPREIAAQIVHALGPVAGVAAIEVAGPGFINFRLAHDAFEDTVRQAVSSGDAWGRSDVGNGALVNVEFVSANPTGPLHVGHGRQAALGDAIARLLEASGWKVTREYYFNDAGRQIRLFGESVAAAASGEEPPPDGYRGAYVVDLAREVVAAGELDNVLEASYQRMLEQITTTLDRFGVHFDVYFGERVLHPDGIAAAIEKLGAHVYRRDGATWLRTTTFGDDKDRVLIRADGEPTYFAADCAYMADKFARGFDRLLYVFGSDHHGYVDRMHALADALGYGRARVEFVVHQFVNLTRKGVAVPMSKRTGELTTFDDLIQEVGVDAARYTFLRFSNDVAIDFDLEAVVREDRDNPVYYVQYSHARITGILRTARERGLEPGRVTDAPLGLLVHDTEDELIRRIGAFPETVRRAADERAPHRVARYTEDLAEAFHRFYTQCQVVGEDAELSRARYWLVVATRQTVVNALGLLGVSAPERM